ncbi:MAG TPA: nucleotide exchange factor GrpE [Planctomycetota bacterium]|jgi:molecular chaperone GrpE|nr:nucleotide exchange factor GrpE [Planctomycetota bacterium]
MSEEKAANSESEAKKPADNGATPATEPAVSEAALWRAKADEYLELARRAKADFINYQDRVRRDKADWSRQSLEGFVRELLPALDGFALAKFEDAKLTEAVKLLEKEFLRVLAKTGVTPIETAGRAFDPVYHDAVAMEPGGTLLEEVRRGWLFDGKVLRPASVRLIKPKG